MTRDLDPSIYGGEEILTVQRMMAASDRACTAYLAGIAGLTMAEGAELESFQALGEAPEPSALSSWGGSVILHHCPPPKVA